MAIELRPQWLHQSPQESTRIETDTESYRRQRRGQFWEEENRWKHYSPEEYECFLEGASWDTIHQWQSEEREYALQEEITPPDICQTNESIHFPIYRVEIPYEDPWGWDDDSEASDQENDDSGDDFIDSESETDVEHE